MAKWHAWQENYFRTFTERDVVRHRLKISSLEMRRFMGMLAHSHGGILNASSHGRSLGEPLTIPFSIPAAGFITSAPMRERKST